MADGSHRREGRVELFYDEEWGTMCYHGNSEGYVFSTLATIDTAHVVCRQLGYPNALMLTSSAVYGLGTGLVILEPWCEGNETRIERCHHFGWQQYFDCTNIMSLRYCFQDAVYSRRCDHSDDIGVECAGEKFLPFIVFFLLVIFELDSKL